MDFALKPLFTWVTSKFTRAPGLPCSEVAAVSGLLVWEHALPRRSGGMWGAPQAKQGSRTRKKRKGREGLAWINSGQAVFAVRESGKISFQHAEFGV